ETSADTSVWLSGPSTGAPRLIVLDHTFVAPQLTVGDAQVLEGNKTPYLNDGTVGVMVPVTLSAQATVPVTATYQVVMNTAGDQDVVISSGTVTIAAGQLSTGVWVNVFADNFI